MNVAIIGSFPKGKYSVSTKLGIEKKKELSQYLANLIKNNRKESFHFLCRCDNSFNQMACMVILELEEHFLNSEITLEIALPFKVNEDDLEENERFRYEQILYLADEVTVVDSMYKYKNPFELEGKYSDKKLEKCNEYLIDCSDLVVFYSSEYYGSTVNALNYARSINKNNVNIHKGVNYGYRNYRVGSI